MTQPSLSSALIFSTLTQPGPLLVLLDGVHCTKTRGALCIQRTTDVHGYDNLPTGGSELGWSPWEPVVVTAQLCRSQDVPGRGSDAQIAFSPATSRGAS